MLSKLLQLCVCTRFFFKDEDLRVKTSGGSIRADANRRSERWIIAGWILIIAKCVALWWLIDAYQVPIHPLWLVAPTVAFGLLATALYIWRD